MPTIRAYAKINWTLDITGRREDGYHEMDMLMQSVSIYDTVTLTPTDGELELYLSGSPDIPRDERNLALRAARALAPFACPGMGARIDLTKRIPSGAGMGGGSADAAAVLVGLNEMWALNLPLNKLCQIGFTLGADVPFCLCGGLKRVRGAGEVLIDCPQAQPVWLVIIQPQAALSTKDVFMTYDVMPQPRKHPDADAVMRALTSGDPVGLARGMANALEPAARALCPQIDPARSALLDRGAVAAMMTGSGSAVYGVFMNETDARAAANALASQYSVCHAAHTTHEGVAREDQEKQGESICRSPM